MLLWKPCLLNSLIWGVSVRIPNIDFMAFGVLNFLAQVTSPLREGRHLRGEAEGDDARVVLPARRAPAGQGTDLCLSFCSREMEVAGKELLAGLRLALTLICFELLCDSQKMHASPFLLVTFRRRGATVLCRPVPLISR